MSDLTVLVQSEPLTVHNMSKMQHINQVTHGVNAQLGVGIALNFKPVSFHSQKGPSDHQEIFSLVPLVNLTSSHLPGLQCVVKKTDFILNMNSVCWCCWNSGNTLMLHSRHIGRHGGKNIVTLVATAWNILTC